MILFLQKIKPFWYVLSKFWHSFASATWFMPVLRLYVRARIKTFGAKKKASIKILALNSSRYRPDLEILNSHEEVVIYTLPHDVQTLLNALFYRHLPQKLNILENKEKYALFRSLENDEERINLVKYLERFLLPLLNSMGIDALMSCSFFYIADIDWQRACANQNIPYFALHKENMQDSVVHDQMVERYSGMKLHFYGQRLFLYNHLVKKVILGAKICEENVITVTGAARMDSLFKKVKEGSISSPKRQITLFSSHHCIGLLKIEGAVNYFSTNPDEGFVKYFDLVHGYVVKFAKENPDIEVYIKPKWGGNWITHIEEAGKKMGFDVNQIPNLHITLEHSAQDLIEQSAVVLGINSTTLLESLIMDRPVIMPLFAEAAEKYYDKHVYFKDYEEKVFNIVRSPEELEAAILNELRAGQRKRSMPQDMISDYLGYCDDKSADRVVKQIKEDIETLKGKKCAS